MSATRRRRRREARAAGRRSAIRVLAAFAASVAGSVLFVVAFTTDASTQLLGLGLVLAFGGVGTGLALWSKGLMPQGPFVEEREDPAPTHDEEEATAVTVATGWGEIGRRGLLGSGLAVALLGVLAAAVSPLRSLLVGAPPAEALGRTAWERGRRVIDETGVEIRADDLEVGEIRTVFPSGHARSVDSQAVLLRVESGQIRPGSDRADWAPGGHLVYSKVCTHAGCPVGLYQVRTHTLLCPCHQASFDVLDAATPVFGPAARPLPQLPLAVDDDGYLVARGDFSEPIGPGYWSRS